MGMKIIVRYELVNVAPRFCKAVWRKRRFDVVYSSAKEAWKHHRRENCCYQHIDSDTEDIVSTFDNAKIDSFGKRYR